MVCTGICKARKTFRTLKVHLHVNCTTARTEHEAIVSGMCTVVAHLHYCISLRTAWISAWRHGPSVYSSFFGKPMVAIGYKTLGGRFDMKFHVHSNWNKINSRYRTAGKFGSLAVRANYHQMKVCQYFLHTYNNTYDDTVPNHKIVNPPILSLELILGDPPNLIPAKFSSYT